MLFDWIVTYFIIQVLKLSTGAQRHYVPHELPTSRAVRVLSIYYVTRPKKVSPKVTASRTGSFSARSATGPLWCGHADEAARMKRQVHACPNPFVGHLCFAVKTLEHLFRTLHHLVRLLSQGLLLYTGQRTNILSRNSACCMVRIDIAPIPPAV